MHPHLYQSQSYRLITITKAVPPRHLNYSIPTSSDECSPLRIKGLSTTKPRQRALGCAMVHRNSFFFSPSYLCGRTYFFGCNKAISGIYSLLPLPPIGPSRGADKGRCVP
ncbi:hypothetical protein CDAR_547811 [Caerostris darwini]|uniref:Uncharacterized protein n=1 Tax=Caerostris darwini TaxID=1538125 RepID=A0AAV4WIE1_9ARAC|nr:hypothetical protein CDAR_547811 [Caerostris darwini]